MAALTGVRSPQATFTPAARMGLGTLAVLAGLLMGAAVGFGISQTMLILGLLAPFAVIAVLARPQWATVVYIVLVYGDLLSIMVRYDGMPSLARFAGVGLLSAALGYRIFVQREKPAGDHVTLWTLAYGAMVALGLIYARAPDLVMTDVIEFVRNFFTYLIVINIITTSSRLHAALYALLGVGTALGCLTLFQSFTGTFDNDYGGLAQYRVSDITSSTEGARPGGTLGDANYFGQLLLILIPIALYLLFEGRSKRARLMGAACAVILTAGVIFTYSRGDAVALGVIIIAAVVYKKPRPVWIVGGLAALVFVVPLLPSNYIARMITVVDLAQGDQQIYLQDDSILGRTGATQAAIAMFMDHPILGVGRENYPLYQPGYLAGTPYARIANGIPPHDLYLEVAAENGIVGILVFGGLLLATFVALRDAWRRFKWAGRNTEKELVIWLAITLIGYLVSALSLHGAFLYILFLQISLIVAARQIARSMTSTQLTELRYRPMLVETMPSVPTPAANREKVTGRHVGIRERMASTLTELAARTSAVPGRFLRRPDQRAVNPSTEGEVVLGSPVTNGPDLTHNPANLQAGTISWPGNPQFDSGWLAAAAAALMGGNTKVARAMLDMALQEYPYDAAAWALHMRLRQAEQGTLLRVGVDDYKADVEAYLAAEAKGGAAYPGHEVDERFYNYWHLNGGLPVFGYAISPRFAEIDSAGSLVEVQYFERARLEYRPGRAGTPLEIVPGNVGMEVPVRGAMEIQLPGGLEGERVIFTTKGTGMPTPRKFFAFWESNGGPDLFGYPITPLLMDTGNEGKSLAVQYFEKARLEYHPEFAGTVYEVQVSKLGVEVFDKKYGHKT
jgi:putative inorganic carbon (hco3(-)) transporter